jgi:Na+-translocating ferredoxin:NAD+ oxidoreductase RnfG subunit
MPGLEAKIGLAISTLDLLFIGKEINEKDAQ